MIEPKRKPCAPWQPGMIIPDTVPPVKPVNAQGHFIVNSTRQLIMRALVSSRTQLKQMKD